MKIFGLILIGGISATDITRFNHLRKMGETIWEKNGAGKFDPQKFWAYGCHCLLLLESDWTETTGAPKDWLDKSCKSYKSCQSCVKDKQGPACIGELIQYKWDWDETEFGVKILDPPGTCPRNDF